MLQVGLSFGDLCQPGYYCPAGTTHPKEMACPAGTWNGQRGAQDASWCLPCAPGFFCSLSGQDAPVGLCAQGETKPELFSYSEIQGDFLHHREDLYAFFKATTAQEGQRLQSQRMVSQEISVLKDISALQVQQLLLPAPVVNTAMQQVRKWIIAVSVWLGKARS